MLKKMLRMLSKHEKGFTLVELMVVVVIIGVLTAIAIPVYNASSARAEQGACQANQRMIDGAIQQYKANNAEGDYPDDVAALVPQYFQTEPKCGGKSYGISDGVVTQPEGCDHKHYSGADVWPSGSAGGGGDD